MEFKEFRDTVIKRNAPKKVKITNSWGVYDAYKLMRKNGWYNIGRPLKEHEFYSIIRKVNKILAEGLAKGSTVVFPDKMGVLELRKMPVGVSLVNGELKNTYPIDWKNTLLLWFEDKEAEVNKTLLRKEVKNLYYVKYNKFHAYYTNRCFYEFKLNRFIKLALKENINKDKVDALW